MTSNWLGYAGRRVVVAGVGGIGSACAAGFAAQGASLLVVDRDQRRLDELASKETFCNSGVQTLALDLTTAGSGDQVVDVAVDRLGGVDVLLHAVGVNDRRPFLEFNEQQWDSMLTTNLSTGFRLGQAAGRAMCAQGYGRIIFVSSVSGLLAHKNHGPYAASKGGMNQMMRVMASEWASSGVTVNAIAPGYVETNLTKAHLAKPGVREQLVDLIPAGRLGRPDEVVGPVLFLGSEHASFVTGHVLYIDGGRTLI